MSDSAYPIPRPESGNDSRFTLGMILNVGKVLAEAGYPAIQDGGDYVRLQQALFKFIYETPEVAL